MVQLKVQIPLLKLQMIPRRKRISFTNNAYLRLPAVKELVGLERKQHIAHFAGYSEAVVSVKIQKGEMTFHCEFTANATRFCGGLCFSAGRSMHRVEA